MSTSATRTSASLEDLYAEADRLEVTPGWVDRGQPIFWGEPTTEFVPAHWRYSDVRPALDEAGLLIDVELAERRNLVMRNPFASNNFATTRSYACAYQMILPGEVAPTHRHAPHALRVMLDAAGTYSVVDGVKVPMETGDIVLTPGGMWHGHGHDGDEPAYWIDALDIPLVHLLEPMLYEEHPDKHQRVTGVAVDSPYRFKGAEIRRLLDAAKPATDGSHGPRIALEAPETPSFGITVERLGTGASTAPHRSNANRVFVVTEGSGTTDIGGTRFSWSRGDTVAVPTWTRFSHHADADSTLVGVSDQPVMTMLGYYRESLDD